MNGHQNYAWNHVVIKQQCVKQIHIYLIFELLQSCLPLPWWQLFTLLAFSQSASPGMLFQLSWRCSHICWALVGCFSFTLWSNSSQTISIGLRPGDYGGWSSDAALHHSPSWSNSPYTAWRCVGSLSCWITNDSPTKRKPDGMVYR